SNIADLALSITGIAGGLWWLGLLHASRPADRPSPFAVAIPIAFCADLVLRAAFRTVPLVDVNPALAAPLVLVAALVFLAAGVAAMSGARTWTRPDFRGGLALIGLPALFLVAETGATNGAQVALASGLGLGPEAARATQLGMAVVGSGGVVTAVGVRACGVCPPAVDAATAVVAIAAVLGSRAALPPWRALPIALVPIAVGVPFLALLLTPQSPPSRDPTSTFRVMTYNIHQGFNAGQVPSLDMLVDVISRESPDVLVLQEVVRGWMIDEQHDALGVLAELLDMPYVFAPNIGDLYGNAILSKFPMTDVKRVHFAVQPSVKHQPRCP